MVAPGYLRTDGGIEPTADADGRLPTGDIDRSTVSVMHRPALDRVPAPGLPPWPPRAVAPDVYVTAPAGARRGGRTGPPSGAR